MARYSATVMDHFEWPRNAGRMENADAEGHSSVGGEASYMTMYLKLQDDQVRQAMFQTFGCGAAIAAGSMLTGMITGRSVAECRAISEDALDEALERLPEERRFCAGLAIRALQDALDQT